MPCISMTVMALPLTNRRTDTNFSDRKENTICKNDKTIIGTTP